MNDNNNEIAISNRLSKVLDRLEVITNKQEARRQKNDGQKEKNKKTPAHGGEGGRKERDFPSIDRLKD